LRVNHVANRTALARRLRLPIAEAFGRKFWLGMLLGSVEISLLIGLISAFGGYSFGSIALSSKGIVGWGLLHLVLFTSCWIF